MSPSSTAPRLGRSAVAVFIGFLVNVIPAVGIDAVLHATYVFPPTPQTMSNGLFALAASYRVLLGVAGAYVTARLAPRRPMLHSLILGAIGIVMCIAGMIAMKDAGPLWYPILLLLITIPCSLLGAAMAHRSVR